MERIDPVFLVAIDRSVAVIVDAITLPVLDQGHEFDIGHGVNGNVVYVGRIECG